MSTLLKTINKEISDFQNKEIQIVPGLGFNQRTTIEKIYYQYNSKFQTGDIDDDGDRKYFNNVNKNPCKVFAKAIDFDTKNIRLITAGGGNPTKTWFAQRDLKYWMREQNFGKVLNRLFREIGIYGSAVLKVIEGKPYFVDLRNFVIQQSAEELDCSNYIIEIHNYTVPEFREVAKQMKWKQSDIDEVIEKYHQMKETSHIRVFERYGEVETVKDDGSSVYEYKRVFLADVGVDEYDNYGNKLVEHPGIELSSDKWSHEELPYWEFHGERQNGRWLGVGVVETLFEPQIRLNEIANVQSKTTYWAGLRVFQTRDPAVNRNLYSDTRNGEVLNVDSEITQIDMSDRNLAFFNQENQKWMQNRSELTFSYDVVQGERLPAGTPLGSAQLAVNQTLSYFEQIQEDIAMDVKKMLYKAVFPYFEKASNAKHTLRLIGQDLDQYIAMFKNNIIAEEVIKIAIKSNRVPTNEERDAIGLAIEETMKSPKEVILKLPSGFYDDLEYDIDIDITGESVDTRVQAATKFAILQAVTADPTLAEGLNKKKLMSSYMEDGGIDPTDFFDVESKGPDEIMGTQQAPAGRAGGGVSAPAMQQAVQGQATQTM